MQVPKSSYYTKQHLWLQKIGLCDFYVGITDFGQKVIGTIDLIELSHKGSALKKGTSWGVVYGSNDTFNLIAPFDGEIVEVNADLQRHTASVNSDPYKHWFAILTTSLTTTSLLTFQDYMRLTE
ncbi:glycine cleavage system protein H [Flavobacteriaceae bacterium F08102]|nr:glycine cleavage system protein H [Flavobacteriaceae bacterium F08102]